jgi:hypothetical protein
VANKEEMDSVPKLPRETAPLQDIQRIEHMFNQMELGLRQQLNRIEETVNETAQRIKELHDQAKYGGTI